MSRAYQKQKAAKEAKRWESVTEAVINVRDGYSTSTARAAGLGVIASCTSSAEAAAQRCADKIFGADNYTLTRYGTASTWIAKRKAGAA